MTEDVSSVPPGRTDRKIRLNYRATPSRILMVCEKQLVAQEYRVVALRECPLPESLRICDTADRAAEYWRMHVATNPQFNPECECFVVLLLNTKHRVKGHHLVSIGTANSTLVHPREVFRAAIISSAVYVVLMHNHPSGDPAPSQADVKVTQELVRAGELVRIEVLDHVIIGHPDRVSMREMGLCGAG